jgi:hypothetical protein
VSGAGESVLLGARSSASGMASLDLLGFERLLPGSFVMGISGVAFRCESDVPIRKAEELHRRESDYMHRGVERLHSDGEAGLLNWDPGRLSCWEAVHFYYELGSLGSDELAD